MEIILAHLSKMIKKVKLPIPWNPFFIGAKKPKQGELRWYVSVPKESETNISLSSLSDRLLNKEPEAFQILYDHYGPLLYGRILTLTPDAQTADLIIEKCFRKMRAEIEYYAFLSDSSLFIWMLQIMVLECRSLPGLSKSVILKNLVPAGLRVKSK